MLPPEPPEPVFELLVSVEFAEGGGGPIAPEPCPCPEVPEERPLPVLVGSPE